MHRRLSVALVLPAIAGVGVALYLSGLAWPILTTDYGFFGRRSVSPMSEPDPVG